MQMPNRRLTNQERDAWIAEYYDNGGASAFELSMVAAINEVRAQHGLHPLTISAPMMHAARFYTQTMSNLSLDLGSSVGPYGGSQATALAFGARLLVRPRAAGGWYSWAGGSGNWGGWSYNGILALWMGSQGHRNFILSPYNNYIGFGSYLGGRRGVYHYLILSNNYSM